MKEIYVLKHTHVESNSQIAQGTVKPTTLQILNLTYALGMDIGLRCRPGSLFYDGYDEQLVAGAEDYLREVRKYEGAVGGFLKLGMRDMLRQRHLGEFQYLWSMLLYGSLQDAGVLISLKPTDISFRKFRKEIGPRLFTEWCLQTGTDPQSVTRVQFENEIMPRENKYRDDYIHQQIKSLGAEKNLLLIGAAHPLESLVADPEFRTYVIEVEHVEGQAFSISGTVPKDLSDIIGRVQTGDNDLSPFLGLGYTARLEGQLEFFPK